MPDSKTNNKILIVLIAGIGDLVLASPAIRAIRNKHVQDELHLLTTTQSALLAKNYAFIDRVWTLPVRELRKPGSLHLFSALRTVFRIRKLHFSILINLYRIRSFRGALKMGLLFSLLKADLKAGQAAFGFDFFLDRKAPQDVFDRQHAADAMLEVSGLVESLPDDRGPEVFWDKSTEAQWRDFLRDDLKTDRVKVALNPGADQPHKRWDPRHYAAVADRLATSRDAEIYLLGGPGEEKIARTIESHMATKVRNFAGRLNLNDLAYLLSRFDLLLTNDSGPMHIAAALHTPLVALFGPETPILFGPYAKKELFRVVYRELDCRPCGRKRCGDPLCMNRITPQEVYGKCLELLNR